MAFQVVIDGYSLLVLIRASSTVKRQSKGAATLFRSSVHAATSRFSEATSGMRRSRHCRERTLSSHSATFSQLPCLGV